MKFIPPTRGRKGKNSNTKRIGLSQHFVFRRMQCSVQLISQAIYLHFKDNIPNSERHIYATRVNNNMLGFQISI